MSLIVEDGTGLETAESYASAAQADTRLAALGMTNWADITTTEKEQALRRATVAMGQLFGPRWKGTQLSRIQALDWPRYGVDVKGFCIPSTEVPADVVNACIDLALKAAAGDLNPDITRAIKREKVGPLETEYADYAPQSVQYRAVDMALSAYLRGGGASVPLYRV